MSSALEGRILKLEQQQEAGARVYVRRILPDGSIKPLAIGQRYAAHVAELPEVCASGEEWLRQSGHA